MQTTINLRDSMKLIAHRGNINGENEAYENKPSYIINAIENGYDVELDIWYINGKFMLGHDHPMYDTNISFLRKFQDKLWIHCKNIESLYVLSNSVYLNVFFHDKDDATLTSRGFIWTYPNRTLTKGSICVLPENGKSGNLHECYGICSDYISKYKELK